MFSFASTYFQLYVRVDILLTCGKNLLDRIISPIGDVWANTISLAPPLFFYWIFHAKPGKWAVMYLSLSTILIFDFEIVHTVSVLFCLFFAFFILDSWNKISNHGLDIIMISSLSELFFTFCYYIYTLWFFVVVAN